MAASTLEVADIIRAQLPATLGDRGLRLSRVQRRVLQRLAVCRTAALGGHLYRCSACDHEEIAFNSCRDRHCPKCQASARYQWLEARQRDLLPVEYFHVVFTLPAEISRIALQNKEKLYGLLMAAAARTLKQIAADPKHLGGEIGFLAVLHTWGQNLHHHPHVHCVVPGGALSEGATRWIPTPRGFFLPVKVLAPVFRGYFLERLNQLFECGDLRLEASLADLGQPEAFHRLLDSLYRTDWVVYAKPPFGGPEQVLRYLARYTHRVAISNDRLLAFEQDSVTFSWKDYAHSHRPRTMTLDAVEFIRRFLFHVLPKAFVRIRYYGFLANRRRTKLEACRRLILDATGDRPAEPILPNDGPSQSGELTHGNRSCPVCKLGIMQRVLILPAALWPRAPPPNLN